MGTVHVVGAGLAGLSAAVALAEAGTRVVLHEAAKQAGGRCRSYYDPALGLTLDNGNHLLLSGNADAWVSSRRSAPPPTPSSGRTRPNSTSPTSPPASAGACAPMPGGCPGG